MEVTQTYAQESTAVSNAEGSHFDFSAELSRKPVALHAMIRNSLSYAKLMLALRRVVLNNLGKKEQDHSRYQAWVQNEYYKELPTYMQQIAPKQKELLNRKRALQKEQSEIGNQLRPLRKIMWDAQSEYYNYLYKHERKKWRLLDPVISVHPDAVIFEAFSLDESTYARVSVPNENLETFGEVQYGTTNIDFSQGLADEIYRVRSYRPAWLKVAQNQVQMATRAGARLEKKIDLPVSWVKGFLQVQSAAALDGHRLRISAASLREILGILEQNKAKHGPRSLRFQLKKGTYPSIFIDPWGIEIKEREFKFEGDFEGEIRIWGRRRLLVLTDVLPVIDQVDIQLLGSGMPSFWSVQLDGHQLDLGLSGWSNNDWAQKASFDLLASSNIDDPILLEKVEAWLLKKLSGTTTTCAEQLSIKPNMATAALQQLCKEGKAMYDPTIKKYRWRDLFPTGVRVETKDEQQSYANSLLNEGKVKKISEKQIEQNILYEFEVEGQKTFKTLIIRDLDGRVKRAECTCGFFRHNKLRKGPCAHLTASLLSI